MEGRGLCPRIRGKVASQESCGTGHTRRCRPGFLSNSPVEHQREEEEAPRTRGGESCSGGDKILQGCGVEGKVTWSETWKAEPHRIKFLIWAVYNVLPSPSNMHTWGLAESPACPLCSKQGTLEHILSCCTTALGEGRYRWRHDQVLKTIDETISTGLEWAEQFCPSKKTITFVRSGDQAIPAAEHLQPS